MHHSICAFGPQVSVKGAINGVKHHNEQVHLMTVNMEATCVLYTMRSSAVASTPLGEKQGSAFSPPSTTPSAAASSRTWGYTKHIRMAGQQYPLSSGSLQVTLWDVPWRGRYNVCKEGCAAV